MRDHPVDLCEKGMIRRKPGRRSRRWPIAMALGLLLGITAATGETAAMQLIRIGTGGKTGVYYPVGKFIAQGVTGTAASSTADVSGENGIPGFIGIAQNSAGSFDNIRGVTRAEIEAGLTQADVAAWAFASQGRFAGDAQSRAVRAIASLCAEKVHIVCRSDAGIRSVADFRGKRISIDEVGSGTLAVARIVLDAYRVSENDFAPVYLKPVFTADKIVSGELQGFVIVAGAPMAAVSQLLATGVTLVPIAQPVAAAIHSQYPYLVPGRIPAGVYPGIAEVETIEVYALLVVSEQMNAALAYRLTAALWSQRTLSLLREGHPQGKSISPETAVSGVSIPLHPGAEKYYREHADRFSSVKKP